MRRIAALSATLLLLGAALLSACGGSKEGPVSEGKALQQIETGRKEKTIAGFIKSSSPMPQAEGPQEFTLVTVDDVEVHGTYFRYNGKRSIPVILMLHQVGGSRQDWRPVAEFLWKAGFGVVTIDFRGHGESTRKGDATLDYRKFADEDWQGLVTDARAALEYVSGDPAVDIVRFGVVGASMGASVAVKVLNQQTDVRSALLVSPGRSYQGLDVTEDIKLREKQTLLVIVGKGDAESADFARFIDENTLAITQGGMERLKEYDTSAHGIDLVNEFMPKGLQKLITDYVIRNI